MSQDDLRIETYSSVYAEAFRRLNEEWLTAYFRIEDVDAAVLGDPQGSIIDAGGDILFATVGDEVRGTAALMYQGEGCYELTKMAVTQSAQGAGIGRYLLERAIQRFEERGGTRLYLETHSSLKAAISLYERAEFRHEARSTPSKYARADVYMVYRPK